jgi:hypothetical protein
MAFRIEHRIGVAAPAAEIWDLIYDLDGWKDWTGCYTRATGKIAIGETVDFTVAIGQRAPQSLKGVIYDWVPHAQLAWTVKMMGGLVIGLRYVEIEALGETHCILANGEYYSGLGARFIPRALRSDIRAAFQTMNEAAKATVEAAWIAKGGQPAAPVPDEPGLTLAPFKRTVAVAAPFGFNRRKAGTMGLSK